MLENLGAANMAFALLPMLTVGAIEALEQHGSEAQKALYLPKLVSGEWSGTMNLTEPQAGSDVGALRTTATPIAEGEHAGKYRIKGTKIFITWGEHELAEQHRPPRPRPHARRAGGHRAASRCSSCPSSSSNADGTLGRAQRPARRSASSTSWASTPRRPA